MGANPDGTLSTVSLQCSFATLFPPWSCLALAVSSMVVSLCQSSHCTQTHFPQDISSGWTRLVSVQWQDGTAATRVKVHANTIALTYIVHARLIACQRLRAHLPAMYSPILLASGWCAPFSFLASVSVSKVNLRAHSLPFRADNYLT